MASQALLFVIVGKNEPLYEYNKVQAADSVTRQNYFVLHSALDLVEKAAWTTNNMYLKVVDKVRWTVGLLDFILWPYRRGGGYRYKSILTYFNLTGLVCVCFECILCYSPLFFCVYVRFGIGQSSASINVPNCRQCQIYAPSRWKERGQYQKLF
mmetsp:Transcript_4291/g.8394  ORF Transcript_4291/g.8394 Transcript_4291/m.8394 type:complete len:154 (+) Transcript_4291:401-862(+)